MSDEGLQRLQQHHEEKSKRIEKNILKYYKVTLGRNESKLRKKKKNPILLSDVSASQRRLCKTAAMEIFRTTQ